MATDEELGPIDIIVIGFPPGAPMTGEAVPLLMELVDNGTVSVLDAMFVTKDENGRVSGFDATDLDSKGVGDFRAFEGASSGLLGEDDMVTAAEALEPGSAAVMLMYENRWAAPFANAVRRNGGQLLAAQRIPIEEVAAALDAAEAAA
jgi:dihydroorotase-like cyclic amidohydrolase